MREKLKNPLIDDLLKMIELARKTGKLTVLTLSYSLRDVEDYRLTFIRENVIAIAGNIEVRSSKIAENIINSANGLIDIFLIDGDITEQHDSLYLQLIETVESTSEIYKYSEINLWANSIYGLVRYKYKNLKNKKVLLLGKKDYVQRLKVNFIHDGCEIYDEKSNKEQVDILIAFAPYETILYSEHTRYLKDDTLVIDGGIKNLSSEFIKFCQEKNIEMIRIDSRAGLSAEIVNILETHDLIHNVMGQTEQNGKIYVAGGIIGKEGDIVVEDIQNLNSVIGYADGLGGLKQKGEKE